MNRTTITLTNDEAYIVEQVLKNVRASLEYDNSIDKYIDAGNITIAMDEISYLKLANAICEIIKARKQ
ncbi:MAG: hypothetical protein NTZ59_02330 [Bacteroidetes bacterium]|nr:hypothetical protein [Bacteroidota bacterium]